jgi:hypothetical protein
MCAFEVIRRTLKTIDKDTHLKMHNLLSVHPSYKVVRIQSDKRKSMEMRSEREEMNL